MEQEPMIGVVGGMSPHAGLALVERVFHHTKAKTDQQHVPVALLSCPGHIHDRSDFLLGKSAENPGHAIARLAGQLAALGATVGAIASNAAHAPAIFDVVVQQLREADRPLRLIHMIDETVRHITEELSDFRRIGILSTLAAYRLKLYEDALLDAGFTPVVPDENVQESIVNRTIFDPAYGLKAQTDPVSLIARQSLLNAIEDLRSKGAEAVILGSAELPLAIPEREIDSVVMLNPMDITAAALVRATYPERLKL